MTTNTKKPPPARRGPDQPEAARNTPGSCRVDVGRCLRSLREERSLSIRLLAEMSGLAINTLSLIENGKTSPSVSTLQQLAIALNVPITAFFESDDPRREIVHIKRAERPCAVADEGRLWLEDLGTGLHGRAIEPFVVTLEPEATSGSYTIVHAGLEFVFCLEGQVAYTIEGETYLLDVGDSLLFEARLPHGWRNNIAKQSRVILVFYSYDARDNPRAIHFAPGGEPV